MAKTVRKQSGRPFPLGVSGNPRGRPKGAFGKRTLLLQRLAGSDPVALFKAQSEIAEPLASHFNERSISDKEAQLAMRIYLSINELLASFLESAI